MWPQWGVPWAIFGAHCASMLTHVCAFLLQVFVSEGGVPYLIHGLMHPDLEVSCCCSEMVARLAASQQQDALEAIR
jgi:hypothetical protein